jgi:SprT-like family
MARPNPIRSIMATPLPSITYQRRKLFRPSYEDINYAYNIINRYVFDNQLRKPFIEQKSTHKAWGWCKWEDQEQQNGSWCHIRLSDKWFCQQWFMNTLAHEMVHQYQWDYYRWDHLEEYGRQMNVYSGGHGPSFYMWRDRFEHYGLNLKVAFGQKRWFLHQNFNKC